MLAPLLLCLLPQADVASPGDEPADSTRFRGSRGNSVIAGGTVPSRWKEDSNVAWTADVEGSGWSSPIVIGDRVLLSSAVDPGGMEPANMSAGTRDPSTMGRGAKPEGELTFRLTCLELASGKTLWTRDVGQCAPKYGIHRSNTFATESPTTDGERVFVTFGALGTLAAFDLEGEPLWQVETGVFPTGNDFGWGISLITHDGLVFLQNDNEERSFLAAFDAETGEQRWRAERPRGTSWGTPTIVTHEERTMLVACGPNTVVAYAPSSGEVLWSVEGIGGSFSSSPAYDEEHVYFGNSGPMSRGPLIAVPLDAEGTLDLRGQEPAPIAWRKERAGPGFASPVVHDGLVYVVASTNVLGCYDAATGEEVYRERLEGIVTVVASPWVVGDELYILDEEGKTAVVTTGPTFELLHVNELPGLYWSTPAIAEDVLLVRESKQLYCIRASS